MKHWSVAGALLIVLLGGCVLGHAEAERRAAEAQGPAAQYVDFAIAACDRVEANIAELTRVAEIMAERHLAGGMIGFANGNRPLKSELHGRSGGIAHVGFERCWKKERAEEEMANDMVIVGLGPPSGKGLLDSMQKLKARGCYLIGFGSKGVPALAEHVKLCDAFFDNGFGPDDALMKLRGDLVVDVMNAWALTAEHVAALTRRGKMPVMAKSFTYADGREWWDRYFGKKQFHDDFDVPPIPPRELAEKYLDRMRTLFVRFRKSELADVQRAAALITEQLARGRKTSVLYVGHMPGGYVGKGEDAAWAEGRYVWGGAEAEMEALRKDVTDGVVTLRLGYAGLRTNLSELFAQKKQQLILIAGEHTRAEWRLTEERLNDVAVHIDMGWVMGDACVPVEGYPIRLFPPSGVMQLVAYEAVSAEVLARLANDQ